MTTAPPEPVEPLAKTVVKGGIGGILMGLANLVPGISGGTMLLAAGVYERFISAIAEVTTLKLRLPSLVLLGSIVVAAMLSIVGFAGPVKDLVVEQRWVMYSLFIGLTLGGVPLVWKLAKPVDGRTWAGAALGLALMIGMALLQPGGAGSDTSSAPMLFLGGVAGASAMILPGLSGGYLLLVLGQYIPILSGIEQLKEGLSAGDMSLIMAACTSVVIPVGIGVVVGVVGVSNAVRWLLERHRELTLGLLLGLLVGSVAGLWPFQQSIDPVIGETVIKGEVVTAERLPEIDKEDYPTDYFSPSGGQVGMSLLLIGLGLGLTTLTARFGAGKDDEAAAA